MSIADPMNPPPVVATASAPRCRPLGKRVMHCVRRAHLYFGLFLFPWAVLYGVTAFLFNHPTAFSDQSVTTFGSEALAGTPMAAPPSATEEAARVAAALQKRAANPEVQYTLLRPEKAAYTREFAFATVRADDRQVSVLLNVNGNGGTVRGQPPRAEVRPAERAPFAVGPRGGPRGGSPRPGPRGESAPPDSLRLDDPLHERVKAAVPSVLERTGFPQGEVTVTSVPDLTFFLADQDGKTWKVAYSAQTGAVSGRPADEDAGEPMSVRRFLTRLHVAHGYPASGGARWWWAVVVDAMAFVMVFWGVSGLVMWWQLKATRRLGVALLFLSAAAATALTVGMHRTLAP